MDVVKGNTLIIVGVGIKCISHVTQEVQSCIANADKILYLVNEPAMKLWIQSLNKNNESLDHLYTTPQYRQDNYLLISNYIVNQLKEIKLLCLVIYGHPTVLVKPAMVAAGAAKNEGHHVVVMPGINAEDCLFADLLIDPSSAGCSSFEATDFLIYQREFDASSHLILWQPYVIGVKGLIKNNHDPILGLTLLKEYLLKKYSSNHEIILYEAAQYPTFKPIINKITLNDLPNSFVTRLTTLYIPPCQVKAPHLELCAKLDFIERGNN